MPPSSFGETSKIEPCIPGFSLKVETYKDKIFITTRPSHSVLLYSTSDNVYLKEALCCKLNSNSIYPNMYMYEEMDIVTGCISM